MHHQKLCKKLRGGQLHPSRHRSWLQNPPLEDLGSSQTQGQYINVCFILSITLQSLLPNIFAYFLQRAILHSIASYSHYLEIEILSRVDHASNPLRSSLETKSHLLLLTSFQVTDWHCSRRSSHRLSKDGGAIPPADLASQPARRTERRTEAGLSPPPGRAATAQQPSPPPELFDLLSLHEVSKCMRCRV